MVKRKGPSDETYQGVEENLESTNNKNLTGNSVDQRFQEILLPLNKNRRNAKGAVRIGKSS